MFKTDERRSVSELLLPPDGYQVESALATTYSLDFVALTSMLAALAGHWLGNDEAGTWQAPEVARAIHALKRRVAIFIEPTRLAEKTVPPEMRKLFVQYDRLVVPVTGQHTSFHPKIWVVKHVAKPGSGRAMPDRYRVICSSRNLTSAKTWECGIVLDSDPRGRARSIGPQVSAFLSRVLRCQPHVDSRIGRLVRQLRSVRFGASTQHSKVSFLGQAPGTPSLLKQAGTKSTSDAVLVSPFVDATFLDQLRKRHSGLRLISKQDQLDLVSAGQSPAFEALRAWLKDDGRAFVVEAGAPDRINRLELHAKLLLTRHGKRGRAFLGSANGTSRGWGKLANNRNRHNWEAVVQLDGREVIKDFERYFMYEDRRSKHLRGWLVPYQPKGVPEDKQAEFDFDQLRNELKSMRLVLTCRMKGNSGEAQLRALPLTDRPRPDLSKVEVRLAPYGAEDVDAMLINAEPLFQGRKLTFAPVALHELTRFVLAELRHRHYRCAPVRFLLIAEVRGQGRGWEDARDGALLKKMLDVPGMLRVFLDLPKGEFSGGGKRRRQPEERPAGRQASRSEDAPILERLLSSWALDPSSVNELRRLMPSVSDARDDAHVLVANLLKRLAEVDGTGRSR